MTELVRREPFMRDFSSLANRFNPLVGSWQGAEPDFFGNWYPAVDLFDRGDEVILHAELPGMKKDDIDIRVENNVLTLSGQRERERELKDGGLYRSERSYGRFSRSFTLPTAVDVSQIRATYQDGVLTVHLPKAEAARPRQIEVNVA